MKIDLSNSDRPVPPGRYIATEMVECAICAAGGLDECRCREDEAHEIPHDPVRDGARARTVYACQECWAQITAEGGAR